MNKNYCPYCNQFYYQNVSPVPLPINRYMYPSYYEQRQQEEKRTLKVSGHIHIKDYEVIGSDEHCNKPIHERKFTLYRGADYALLFSEVLGCGGECRTEVDVWGRLRKNGQMVVTVYTYFFEGSSEGTNELEDQKESVHHLLPKGVPITITHELYNVDTPGDDRSTVTLNFINIPWEPSQ